METLKLTAREESYIISEKSLDYTPNPKGLGYELFCSMVVNRDVIAQIDAETEESDTYGKLLRKCIRTSIQLLWKGLTKDDIICQCSVNHINSCVPIICALFLGVAAASLEPSFSLEETTQMLHQIRPRIIFVSPDSVQLIEDALEQVDIACEIVLFGPSEFYTPFESFILEPVENESDFRPLPIRDLTETAIILFSSASEAARPPKGICLSHYTLMVQLVNTVPCWNLGKKIYITNYLKERNKNGFMVAMSFTSYYLISAIQLLTCSTMTGVTRIICRNFEPTTVWKLIDKHNVSFMICPTFQAVELHLAGQPEAVEGKTLGMLVTSGTRLTPSDLLELRRLFPRCFITNAYVVGELGGALTMFNYSKPRDIRDQYEAPTSCGKLMPGLMIKIVDPITKKILGANKAGELCYKSAYWMNEYLNLDSDFLFDDYDWIKTGDIATYDERHCIHVLSSYVFRYKCWDIIPSIIENVLKLHPAVKQAVVLGIPVKDEDVDQHAMAIVTVKKGMRDRGVTDKDIEDFGNAILTNKQRLRGGLIIINRKDMPLTLEGEPKRDQLRIMAMEHKNKEDCLFCNC